jgi:hypothetical protein
VRTGERDWWKGDLAFVLMILAVMILGVLAALFGRFEAEVAVLVVVVCAALYRSRYGL